LHTISHEILDGLNQIPVFDVHTHIDALHMSARGLHDILLYHMGISDLYSAGCPNGTRLSEEPDTEEIYFRVEQALPYLRYVQNTSCFWGIKTILKELYEWDEPISTGNWRKIHEIISAKSQNSTWPREILNKAGIARTCTELCRRHGGKADDIFQYSLEWAFFTRTQWGQYDTALLELENAWGQDEPGAPLPVTLDSSSLNIKKRIKSLDDVAEAIEHYCSRIPYDRIISIASHLSTDIQYRSITDEEMEMALVNRKHANEKERDIYSNYIFERFLNEFAKYDRPTVLQFSMGAEPLRLETASKLKAETVFQFAHIAQSHPKIKFQIFLASEHQNQALCTLARECPNVSLAGYWWHNFFPTFVKQVIGERLDMVAANKQIGFFSDAYCVDWAFAKLIIVKRQMAEVLTGKVEQGQYTINQALDIAKQILYETPKELIRMTSSAV
jgi:glucuronate isomerase